MRKSQPAARSKANPRAAYPLDWRCIVWQMCGADGAHDTACLDLCSGYEGTIDEDEFTYRYYTVRNRPLFSRAS